MNKTKYIWPGLLILFLTFAESANAAVNTAVLFSTSGIIDLILLLGVFICLLWSMSVMSLVRGGLMSKSWQMFTLGFIFLVLARLVGLSGSVNLFVIPEIVPTVLYLLMIVTWLIGIYQTKRILA